MTRRKAGSSDADYEVGYCRPPERTRFQKGQSGNPAGRAKGKKAAAKRESFVELLNRVSQREITITVNDRQAKVTMLEAMLTKTFQQALAGKQDAVRTILSHFGQVDEWVQNRILIPRGEALDKLAKDPHEIARAYKRLLSCGVVEE